MRHWASGIAAAALVLTGQAFARDLPVPAGKAWKHAVTGLILDQTLDGLPRTQLIDLTTSEHDVMGEYSTPDHSEVVSVYLFHPGIDDVAMWFERAEVALGNRETYGDVAPSSADPIAFAAPQGRPGSALRRIYAPGKGAYRSTGLAMLPLGDWLVAIRLSSVTMPPRDLDGRLTRIIGALRWPAGVTVAPAATSIVPCATPLAFDRKAKPVKAKGEDAILSLFGASLASAAAEKKDQSATTDKDAPPPWCRDPASALGYGVYRRGDTDEGYAIALQDAGRTIAVWPSIAAQIGKRDGYAVTLTDVDGTHVSFPDFDRLPAPEAVIAALSGPRLGTTKDKTISINASVLGK